MKTDAAPKDGDSISLLERVTHWFLPASYEHETESYFRGSVVVALSFLLSIFGPIYAWILFSLTGAVDQMVATLLATAGVVAAPFMMKRGVPFGFLGNWLTFCGYALFVYVSSQDMGPAVLIWLIVFMILAALISGRRSALVWLVISSVTTTYFYATILPEADAEGVLFSRAQLIWEMCLVVGMFVAVLVLTLAYESIKDWALDQARRQGAHTRAVLDAAPDGIITLSVQGRVDDLNPAAIALFDYDKEEIADAPLTTLIPASNRRPPTESELADEAHLDKGQLFARAGDGGLDDKSLVSLAAWTDQIYPVEGVTRGGRRFPAELFVTGIEGEGRYVAVVRDVTAERAAKEALRRARDKAVEANEAKSRFLANVSHELRTPLNAIIGYSELVAEDLETLGEGALVSDVKKVGSAGKHLLSLINEVLDLSKVEAGEMQIYVEDVDLAQLVGEVADTMSPLIDDSENRLRLELTDAPATMRVDEMKLRQILINLLSNATKFTDDGLIRVNVFGETRQEQDWVVFEVIDRGIGIAEDKLDQLFEAFKQADDSTTRRFGGTGLGLTICRHFSQLMGGDIGVESQPGEGSTFRVTLPVDVAAVMGADQDVGDHKGGDERGDDGDDRAPSESPSDGAAGSQKSKLPTVLVIDDDPTVHRLMERFLEREGFQVATSGGGPQALEQVRQVEPDIITLDVLMPDVDGWNILEQLKSSQDLADIPVVMLTIINDRNLGFSLGATDYLSKPVDPQRLVKVLSTHLSDDSERPILIVEDDDATRAVLESQLIRSGWTVQMACDGKDALEQLNGDLRPAAVLLDLMMPRMDGFELLDRLRSQGDFEDMPIIVVSAADLTADQRTMLQGQADQILRKDDEATQRLVQELRGFLHRKERGVPPGKSPSQTVTGASS